MEGNRVVVDFRWNICTKSFSEQHVRTTTSCYCAEEAANCEPPSEEEYFYASSSEEGEVSEPEDAGQQELYEEGFSEEEQGLIDEDVCAETKNQTEPEEKQDEKNQTATTVEEMHMRIAMEASLKEVQRPQEFSSSELLEEADDEGILEEETQFHREILQTQRWKINFLDENWELAKILIISEEERPTKLRKHPYAHSMIVSPSVVPKKIQTMAMDGDCFFSCISFAMFRDVKHKDVIRDNILCLCYLAHR